MRVAAFFPGHGEAEHHQGDHARDHDLEVVARGLEDDDGGGQRDEAESDDENGFSQQKSWQVSF